MSALASASPRGPLGGLPLGRGASTGESGGSRGCLSLGNGGSRWQRFSNRFQRSRGVGAEEVPAMLSQDAMRSAAWGLLVRTGRYREVALRLKARFGWHCSDRAAVARLSQMLSPGDPHQLPADALPDLIAECGEDPFTPILLRVRLRRGPLRAGERRRRADVA